MHRLGSAGAGFEALLDLGAAGDQGRLQLFGDAFAIGFAVGGERFELRRERAAIDDVALANDLGHRGGF